MNVAFCIDIWVSSTQSNFIFRTNQSRSVSLLNSAAARSSSLPEAYLLLPDGRDCHLQVLASQRFGTRPPWGFPPSTDHLAGHNGVGIIASFFVRLERFSHPRLAFLALRGDLERQCTTDSGVSDSGNICKHKLLVHVRRRSMQVSGIVGSSRYCESALGDCTVFAMA
jgi:hypothetical protein